MKNSRVDISVFVVIPQIFCGLVVLSSIIVCTAVKYAYVQGGDPAWIAGIWTVLIVAIALVCSLTVTHAFVHPVREFLRNKTS